MRSRSLYSRIALIFISITVVMGAVQIYFIRGSVRELMLVLEQQVNWNLASELSFHLQPLVRTSIDVEKVQERLTEVHFVNRKHEIYFVDEKGNVLPFPHFDTGQIIRKVVRLDPIKAALSPITPAFPLYGDNPNPGRSGRGTSVFSAAPITIEGKPGYLYVILSGVFYENLFRVTGQHYLVGTLLRGFSVILAASLLLGLLLFFYLTKQLRALSSAVQHYRGGDFTRRVAISSKDELSELADAVNAMAATIQKNDSLRKQFFASISHDLRGPLTSIRGFLETMKANDPPVSEEDRTRYLDIMYNNVLSQNRLIDDLFDLAKLETGQRQPQLESFSLSELVHDSVLGFEPQARAKQISLEFLPPSQSYCIDADVRMIERVILNLISNALRYTDNGGRVAVSLHKQNGSTVVSVEDTGIGIAPDHIDEIFSSFYRVEMHREKKAEGSGLGLAIAMRIAELHGGTVEVESELGQGSVFRLVLPSSTANR